MVSVNISKMNVNKVQNQTSNLTLNSTAIHNDKKNIENFDDEDEENDDEKGNFNPMPIQGAIHAL